MTHIANDLTPPVRGLSAVDRAMRTVDWATRCLGERSRLKPAQRSERAIYYDQRAERFLELSKLKPSLLELAGMQALAASIMRARD